MTPSGAQREGFRWLPTAVLCLIVLGVFIGVAQHFGFILDTQNVKHQGKILQQQYQNNQNSQQYQAGWYDKLSSDYRSTLDDQATEAQVPASDLPSVKAAVLGDAGTVCYDYTKVNQSEQQVPADIVSWYNANCSGTSVSLSSGLRK